MTKVAVYWRDFGIAHTVIHISWNQHNPYSHPNHLPTLCINQAELTCIHLSPISLSPPHTRNTRLNWTTVYLTVLSILAYNHCDDCTGDIRKILSALNLSALCFNFCLAYQSTDHPSESHRTYAHGCIDIAFFSLKLFPFIFLFGNLTEIAFRFCFSTLL